MRKLLALGVLALANIAAAQVPASPAPAWALEPDSYRGLKWGTSLVDSAEVLRDVRGCVCLTDGRQDHCGTEAGKDEAIPDERVCPSSLTVGSISVTDTFLFYRDRFTGALMDFDSKSFEQMRAIFEEKYGPPLISSETPVQNRMGMKASNYTLTWRGPAVTVILSRFGSKLTRSNATIATNEFFERLAQESADKKKAGAKVF